MKTNYSVAEATTYDISEEGNGSLIATLSEDGVLTICGTGKMKKWTSYTNVEWYEKKKEIKQVKIEEGVTNIGTFAFYSCTSLTNIVIPNSVTAIGNYAFRGCTSLVNIELPNRVTSIGRAAFFECTSLTKMYIPNSVSEIGESAFSMCKKLTEITVESNNANYYDDKGVLYTKDKTKLIVYPAEKDGTEYTILSDVTSIESYAFSNCKKLKNINILEGVTTIGSCAFEYCTGLIEIYIPSSVITINDYVFNNTNLTNIKLPDSVTLIDDYAFHYCISLLEIEIPSSITNIEEQAFSSCKLNNFVSPENYITELPNILKRAQDEEDVLYSSTGFELKNCTINNNYVEMNEGESYASILVKEGKLKGLKYRIHYNQWDVSKEEDGSVIATLSKEGTLTFSGKMKNWNSYTELPWYNIIDQVKIVKLEEGVTNIGERVFNCCTSLKKVEMPNSITSIGNSAFWGCTGLEEVEIPKSVTTIGANAFYICTSLEKISIHKDNLNYCDENGILFTKDKTRIITYPAKKKETEYIIPSSVTHIQNSAFYLATNLRKIIIPSTVTNIGNYIFTGCDEINIVCSSGSTAETYAKTNDVLYVIDDEVETVGTMTMKLENSTGNNYINDTWTEQNVYIEVNEGKDELSGHKKTTYTVNGGEETTETQILNEPGIYEIVVTTTDNLGNTATNTYIIKIERLEITSNKYKIENAYISKVQEKTTVKAFKEKLQTNATEIKVYSKDGVEQTETTAVATGMKVEVKYLSQTKTFTLVVSGDANGDGEIKLSDMSIVNRYRLNKRTLEGESLLAGDVNEDGKVDFKDIVKINRFRLHKITEL